MQHVPATPEEVVRQAWIRHMIGPLGYPKGLLAVEKAFGAPGGRRVDLLCYTPGGDGLVPLLLVECKAVAIDEEAAQQLFGYNETIGAPFVALLARGLAKTLWRGAFGIESVPFLPSYAQLVERL